MSSTLRQRRVLTEEASEFLQDLSSNVSDVFDKERRSQSSLGFRHWLITITAVAILYGLVVFQDKRLPDVQPADQFKEFSEVRARQLLDKITALGPRPSGSVALEVDAFNILSDKIGQIKHSFDRTGVNRLEVDVQRPSGCFNLKFLSSFTLCYHKITNVLVRIGPKSERKNHAVLLNCHFDTLPDTPGATDDAVSCVIMMEILEVLSKRPTELENDIIFLFNGAEENFLQASHGFINNHPWRYDVRAFINLEGTGSGGREILFQAGPGDSWILKTYLDNAPHPHCSVIAQEIFQSGVIPSDTDFRVLRDYGKLSGLDIAYHRNGWVYHTEFDKASVISTGSIQRGGDNVLAVTQALVRSPYLTKPANYDEGNKWVFFDVVGLWTIFYEVSTGDIFNFIAIGFVAAMISFRLYKDIYTVTDLFSAFWHNIQAFFVMLVTGLGLVCAVHLTGLTMCWYSMPELVFPIYIVPMLITGSWTHSRISESIKRTRLNDPLKQEIIHYDSVLVFWSCILLFMTAKGLASSFFILIHVLFPMLRDPLFALYSTITKQKLTPQRVLFTQWICLVPVIAFVSYAVMLFFDFFVPVMGRMGQAVYPEFLMMPLSLLTAWTFVLFTSNLVYVSRRMDFLLKSSVATFAFIFILIATTSLGVPYKWSDDGLPRLRRILALHSKRSVYNFDGSLASTDTGLFVQSFDYRGVDDLPAHTFLQGSDRPNCAATKDEYCQLPYYTAIHEVLPPHASRWVPLPQDPTLPKPLSVRLENRTAIEGGRYLNMSFVINGGVDKMSLHITPINGYKLSNWSFTELDHETFGRRDTYFVFWTYGHEPLEQRYFWILLEQSNSSFEPTAPEVEPHLELAVATHYAHGRYQNSPTLFQLRALINTRRQTPQAAVGYWKWAITMIGGSAELVAHFF